MGRSLGSPRPPHNLSSDNLGTIPKPSIAPDVHPDADGTAGSAALCSDCNLLKLFTTPRENSVRNRRLPNSVALASKGDSCVCEKPTPAQDVKSEAGFLINELSSRRNDIHDEQPLWKWKFNRTLRGRSRCASSKLRHPRQVQAGARSVHIAQASSAKQIISTATFARIQRKNPSSATSVAKRTLASMYAQLQ